MEAAEETTAGGGCGGSIGDAELECGDTNNHGIRENCGRRLELTKAATAEAGATLEFEEKVYKGSTTTSRSSNRV